MDRVDFDPTLRTIYRIPKPIVLKLMRWAQLIEQEGLEEIRKIPGFHDEPLKGKRMGQRSIRLNRSYRAIYSILRIEGDRIIRVEEVSKHEY